MRSQLITLIAANGSIERQPQKQRLSRQQTRGRPPVILSSDRGLIAGRFGRHRAQGDFDLGGFIQQAAFAAAGQGSAAHSFSFGTQLGGEIAIPIGQQPFGKGAYEDHRQVIMDHDIVDRADPTGTIGEADVGKDQFGVQFGRHRGRFAAGPGYTDDLVAKRFHDRFDIKRDDRLIFDDHDLTMEAFGDCGTPWQS